ncbi:MAG: class I SAM-dependent methyltransferase [Bdellovibrionaceae bacterium]|nr:class I SAM-dependent methyltransferase [Pseudobdellovibrionaceae bacterium]
MAPSSVKPDLEIDFDRPGPDYHRKAVKGRRELLARAVGAQQGARKILDLSAGLAQDAVFLCQMGFTVTAVERHPVIAGLLTSALQRTRRPELRERLTIREGDARDVLREPDCARDFDAAYFDPMYPLKKKSALPRKEMLLFRELVGDDADAAEVVRLALRLGPPRLAVKRPLKAPPLLEGVKHSFEGTTVRYDIYVRS